MSVACPPSTSTKNICTALGGGGADDARVPHGCVIPASPPSAAVSTTPPRTRPTWALEQNLSCIFYAPRPVLWVFSLDFSRTGHSTCRTRGNSAVHEQRLPCYVAAGLGREKNHSAIQVLRLPGTFHWDPFTKILDPLLVFVKQLILFRAKPARCQAIYCDSMLAPIVREAHRQLLH